MLKPTVTGIFFYFVFYIEHASDRRITCFEMGNTDDSVVVRQQSSDRYIGCYGRWVERKKKYVAWKERNGEEMDTKTVFSLSFWSNLRIHYEFFCSVFYISMNFLSYFKWQQYSKKEIDEQRRILLQQGMTYEEWLGLKEKESRQSTPSGTKGCDWMKIRLLYKV